MIHFECDYTEGACPQILDALIETNMQQTTGYGNDPFCQSARNKIRDLCGTPDADVHFLTGGTQANLTVISAALRPYQGVIAPDTGHINAHETGSIESCGHKILAIPTDDGRISAARIRDVCIAHQKDPDREHTVQPGMIYISFPTETGLLYSKASLEAISEVCREYNMLLFIDGARLGYGLSSPKNDCTLQDIARFSDVFYIGGTKVGALFGEAVVIKHETLKKDFRYMIKQKGGMLAKGRLLGIQFDTLLTDNLYFTVAEKAVQQALRIREAFLQKGFLFLYDSYTNQLFPVLPAAAREILGKKYCFSYWKQVEGEHVAVRFCTSWATTDEAVQELIQDIQAL